MPRNQTQHNLTDASRGKRLQRVLADAGVGSRRACEAMIENGDVSVNGQLVTTLPAWVDPEEDRIVVAGKVVAQPDRKLYIMLNKPPRTLSTAKDEPGADRRTVTELVDHPAAPRLFPVGRLDYDTVGLILLTNDGELANRLTHPRYGVPKTYRVVVKGSLDEEAIKELERGIYLAQRKAGHTQGAARTAHVEIALVARERDKTTVELTLREGRNRQVRRMLAAVGYPVKKLERVGMGPVKLKGLARGQWRELTRDEIRALKRSAADQRRGDKPKKETGSSGTSRRRRSTAQRERKSPYISPEVTGPSGPIRNRTMKNAINKATKPAPDREGSPKKRRDSAE
ncbi:MAG: pseudouridine synthase [Phycisphaerales bacterium JB047]